MIHVDGARLEIYRRESMLTPLLLLDISLEGRTRRPSAREMLPGAGKYYGVPCSPCVCLTEAELTIPQVTGMTCTVKVTRPNQGE